jgi:hypothetical protein
LVDLWFADEKDKRVFNCALCSKNPLTAKERKCESEGFENLRKPRRVDNQSLEYYFCAGKATWYEEISELFLQCRTTMETGILPRKGSLEEQDETFYEVFPFFVQRWKDRQYARIWQDVRDFTKVVLEGIFGKKGR